jgi:hypothetical protein
MDLDPAAVEAAKTAAWAQCTHEDIGQCWQECNDIEAAVRSGDWVSAEPRPATRDEIEHFVALALSVFQ